MSEYLSKGKSLVGQADRKLLSLGWFSNKYEEAAELLERGANQLKLAKACERGAARGPAPPPRRRRRRRRRRCFPTSSPPALPFSPLRRRERGG
jgi:hypothetical protein